MMEPGKQYHVRKKPVVLKAEQTATERVIQTLEGPLTARVGDYVITGTEGEQWPVKKEIFEKTYEVLGATD